MNKRGYCWKELEEKIHDYVRGCKSIHTIGTIGSLDLEHDVDIIAFARPGTDSSDYFRELHGLFFNLNHYLEINYGKRVIRFSNFVHEEDVKHIAQYEQGDLAIHVMAYVNLPQLSDSWAVDRSAGFDIVEFLKSKNRKYTPIVGNYDEWKKLDGVIHSQRYESFYTYMNDCDRTNSHYPDNIYVRSINHLARYMAKHVCADVRKEPSSREDALKLYYLLADKVDLANSSFSKL